ncbi:sporulation membrane protein YtrI [Bacillus sp. SCS-151]|uniref:sporulation membrane protein YtrI n=1 Tax=Nanhaiella sioensis TaxID=3115293 RepID=UPI00397B02FB
MVYTGTYFTMRIPPHFQLPNWQRFFAGVAIGAIISWLVFLYMFGVLQEKQVSMIERQQKEIFKLNNDIKIWQDDYRELNEKNKKQLTLQEIIIDITAHEKFNLDQNSIIFIQEEIRKELSSLLAKDIETVYKNSTLLEKSIENKPFTINEKSYRVRIKKIGYFTTLYIHGTIEIVK